MANMIENTVKKSPPKHLTLIVAQGNTIHSIPLKTVQAPLTVNRVSSAADEFMNGSCNAFRPPPRWLAWYKA